MRAMLHRRYLTVLAVVPLLGALATTGAQADTATWNVAEDSYTSQSNAAATHGSATYLGTDAVVGSERRAYLKFTVSNIPTGATNVTAKVRIYAQSSSSATFTVHNIPSNWTQSGLTWSNQPALGSTVVSKVGVTLGYNDLDVSSTIKANGTYSFAISNSAATQVNFTSKEATSSQPTSSLSPGPHRRQQTPSSGRWVTSPVRPGRGSPPGHANRPRPPLCSPGTTSRSCRRLATTSTRAEPAPSSQADTTRAGGH